MKTQIFGVGSLSVRPGFPRMPLQSLHAIIPLTTLQAANKEKEINRTMPYLRSAYKNYRDCRENGEPQDNPTSELKHDGKAEWEKQPNGWYHVKYTEGYSDKAWMEEKDWNYVFRLEREGRLDKLEPNLRTEVPKLYEKVMAYRAAKATEAKALAIENNLANRNEASIWFGNF